MRFFHFIRSPSHGTRLAGKSDACSAWSSIKTISLHSFAHSAKQLCLFHCSNSLSWLKTFTRLTRVQEMLVLVRITSGARLENVSILCQEMSALHSRTRFVPLQEVRNQPHCLVFLGSGRVPCSPDSIDVPSGHFSPERVQPRHI
jgi:hypothetical protein